MAPRLPGWSGGALLDCWGPWLAGLGVWAPGSGPGGGVAWEGGGLERGEGGRGLLEPGEVRPLPRPRDTLLDWFLGEGRVAEWQESVTEW